MSIKTEDLRQVWLKTTESREEGENRIQIGCPDRIANFVEIHLSVFRT